MNLIEAIQPNLPARIAIVGAGGKTTALFQLAHQVSGLAWATTTTHLGTDQLSYADRHFIVDSPAALDFDAFIKQRVTLITGPFTADARVHGPSPEILEALRRFADRQEISLIVEADGSRSRPIKAPAENEPVIPGWAKHVIVVVGLSALGRPFNGQWVHRPEQFAKITHLQEGEPIGIQSIRDLLISPQGGLKGMPRGARKIALLNQAEAQEVRDQARGIAPELLAGGFDQVIVGGIGRAPSMLECCPER